MSLSVYTIAQLLDLKPPSWLIEGVVPEQGLIALYGAPGDGKSFIALDMALCVAAGIPWQGHVVQKAYVVYVSAEGGGGISKRVAAWLTHHHIASKDYDTVLANFVVSAISIHPESSDLEEVLESTIDHPDYRNALAEYLDPDEDGPLLFIIIDTLARCFQGDENQQEDMGQFVRRLDDLREQYAATVLVVHHSKKADSGERGSSAFRGACDTMMFAQKEDMAVTLECTKQKDYEPFPTTEYDLLVLPEHDSCVLGTAGSRETAKHVELLNEIRDVLMSQPDLSIRDLADALGQSKSTIHRMIQRIRAEG